MEEGWKEPGCVVVGIVKWVGEEVLKEKHFPQNCQKCPPSCQDQQNKFGNGASPDTLYFSKSLQF